MKKYKSTKNGFVRDKEAQKIGEYVEKKFGGIVDSKTFLSDARNKSSPLHKYFEWDDSVAAEKYRLMQARNILLSIEVYIDSSETDAVRAFHNVFISDETDDSINRTYVSLERARNNRDLWDQIIESAMREAMSWKSRYQHYKELSKISKSIQETHKKLERKKA